MTKKLSLGCLGLLLGLTWATSAPAQQIDSDVDISNRVLYVETDWTHDFVVFSIDSDYPNHLTIQIAQFANIEDMGSFMTVEDVLENADESDVERRRLDQFDRVEVRVYEGDDAVSVYPNVYVPFLIVGGPGNDQLEGGSSDDEIYGDDAQTDFAANQPDAGNDSLFGGGGRDLLYGGPLDDYLDGGNDNDFLYGERGRDRLLGRDGKDSLYGGEDDDYLDGGFDGYLDVLTGGNGKDYYVATQIRLISEMVTTTIRNKVVTRKVKRPEILERDIITDFDWQAGDERPAVIVD